jgi:leukotriene-A4 hydrolase
MRLITLAALLAAPLLAAAQDPHSFARSERVVTTHLHLDLAADFEARSLHGFAELTLDWRDREARTLDLDTRDLTIERVLALYEDGGWMPARPALAARAPSPNWRPATFTLGKRDAMRGSHLSISLRGQPSKVRIHYRTAPGATGLQWLAPVQTLSGAQPFMFSQSQAIHARSWVPLQDTPAVRFPFTARITAPEGLRVVMGANNDPGQDGRGGWRFVMPQPIPSYLLAIAIGELAHRDVGPRTTIWAEPGRLDAAADEFADTEAMIAATEALYGPYRWGRYDLLILPPSFPYGGMENPRLSFITPTVLAGDRSLVALIAHELAHSWSGNLVTNATWADFWLNEGFTTYVENRIVESLYGTDRALMEERVGQVELMDEMRELAPHLQSLLPGRVDDDPDAVFSGVPYQKGAWFLRTIEQRVGREVFDPFLRGWFDEHAFQSVRTEDFLVYLRKNLLAGHPEAMPEAELAQWIHQPGVPASARKAQAARLEAIDALRARWLAGELAPADFGAATWSTQEWLHFLNALGEAPTVAQLEALDAVFKLSQARNSEIAFRWFMAGIRAGYAPVRAPLEQFLSTVGRRKFVAPLFTELAKRPQDQAWANALYAKVRERYHPVTQAAVDAVLGVKAG